MWLYLYLYSVLLLELKFKNWNEFSFANTTFLDKMFLGPRHRSTRFIGLKTPYGQKTLTEMILLIFSWSPDLE